MLADLINALISAPTPKAKERAYRMLERVGMDRRTADILIMKVNVPAELAELLKQAQKGRIQ